MKRKQKTNNKQKNYKPHSIDSVIVSFLQRRDEGKFGTKDKIFFFKELTYLVTGWIGISDSIKLIYQNTDNFAIKSISKTILEYLHEWKTLAYAMSRLPDYFDEGDINIIKAWEQSGNLILILKSLAQEYGFLNTMKNKYIGALMYPMVLILVAVAAVIGLFGFVLPEIFKVVASFPGVDLPLSTQILKWISDFVTGQWKILIAILGVTILIVAIFLSTNTGKKAFFSILIDIPILGKMTKYFYLIKWCRYMKVMFSAGMSYVETFTLLRDILWISMYQEMIERVLAGLQRGESIYNTLKFEQHIIPTNVSTLIKVWEESANLTNTISNVLHIYEEELNTLIDRLSKIIEPIMLVLIGWIVIVIAFWVFGLIFEVMEGAGL